jgi:outer membrane protein TolC
MRSITAAASAVLILGGCASFSPDGGADKVSDLVRERTGQSVGFQRNLADVASASERTAELLEQPLTADRAVEIALLNNRELQASFSDLGIAEANLVRAGRLANPVFSFSNVSSGGDYKIERSVLFNVLGLITLPVASQVARRQFEQAQIQAASDAVGVAAEARRAFFGAVSAQDLVNYYGQVKEAAEASNELARRMLQAGNFNKLTQMREQAFYADATAGLARARHQAVAERERLARALGLASSQALKLPERLPDLPGQPVEPRDAEQTALEKRLDVMLARRATDATARSLGLTRATRFVNVLEAGYANVSEGGSERKDGYEIQLELPLFDFGLTRTVRAEAIYMQALHRTAQVAVSARAEVRESYSAYRTAYDLARHYRDEIVPLRKRISEENLLRYNGMMIGVFELLADSREQIRSVTDYIEVLRAFWVAQTDLQTALVARSPGPGSSMRPSDPTAAADQAH